MVYPTPEQYNQSLQHPELHFTDPELQKGSVKKTGWGLPFANCGGFALTYEMTCSGKKYAVRCFHKESKDLERRYAAISKKIKELNSDYFVNEFEFIADGFKLQNKPVAPIVKMAWAEGDVLGQFVEDNYDNPQALANLRKSLEGLAEFLEINHIAHGDIQPGNLIVTDDGKKVQLIDYDGMFVEELKDAGNTERGIKNFQHPQRSNQWDATLDRFSFILIDLSLSLLEKYPDLWDETGSDIDAFLFRANDIYNPDASQLFQDLKTFSDYEDKVDKFSNLCKGDFDKIPSLKEFLYGKTKPKKVVVKKTINVETSYISSFEVLDATNYELCLEYVGDKVELIGEIKDVRNSHTTFNKPYCFINFDIWTPTSKLVRLTIWNEGLEKFTEQPNKSWKGKWISVSGLLEPPFRKKGYESIGITIYNPSLIHEIDKDEADYRLGKIKKIITQVIEEEVEDVNWQKNEELLNLSKTLMYQKKFNDAKKALDKVFQTGNDEQQQQAQDVLVKIEELEQREKQKQEEINNYLLLANKEIANNNFENAKFYIQETLEMGDNEQKQKAKDLLAQIEELERKEQQRKAKIDNYLVLANSEISNKNFKKAKDYLNEVDELLEIGDIEQKQKADDLFIELESLEKQERERIAKKQAILWWNIYKAEQKRLEKERADKENKPSNQEILNKIRKKYINIQNTKTPNIELTTDTRTLDELLDLAEKEINLAHFDKARDRLNDIISKAGETQKERAKLLLDKLKQKEELFIINQVIAEKANTDNEIQRTKSFDQQSQEALSIKKAREEANKEIQSRREPYQKALDEVIYFIENTRHKNGEKIFVNCEELLNQIERNFYKAYINNQDAGVKEYKKVILSWLENRAILEKDNKEREQKALNAEIEAINNKLLGISEKEQQKIKDTRAKINQEREKIIKQTQELQARKSQAEQEAKRLELETIKKNKTLKIFFMTMALIWLIVIGYYSLVFILTLKL